MRTATTLDALKPVVWVIGADGTMTYLSAGGKEYGWDAATCTGRPYLDFIPPEGHARAIDLFAELHSGRSIHSELPHLRFDNQQVAHFSLSARPTMSRRGEFICALGTSSDITRRVNAEHQVLAANERYRQLLDSTNVAMWTVDLTGAFSYLNNAVPAMLGHDVEDMLGRRFTEFVIDADITRGNALFAQLMGGEAVPSYEISFAHRDGHVVTVHASARPMLDDDGHVVGATGHAVDVSDRVAAQERLRESEERCRLVLAGTADGLWDFDLRTREIVLSARLQDMLGVARGDAPIPGRDVSKSIHAEDFDMFRQAYCQHLKNKTRLETRVRLRRHDGNYVWCQVHAATMRDAAGEPVRSLGTVHDITEQSLSLHQRERVAAELHESALQELAAASIYADTLLRELTREGAAQAELASSLVGQLGCAREEMQELIRALRHQTFLTAQQSNPLTELVEAAVGMLRRQHPNVVIDLDLDTEVRRSPDSATLDVYADVLREAATAAISERHATHVRICSRLDSASLRATVTDNGDPDGAAAIDYLLERSQAVGATVVASTDEQRTVVRWELGELPSPPQGDLTGNQAP